MGTSQFDVIIIGGGPGGSLLGTRLAREGRRVLLLERERFPRFHIGESLIVQTVRAVERAGVRGDREANGWLKKHGITFYDLKEGTPAPFYFGEPVGDIEGTYAYHVDRATWDDVLLRHAASVGVDVRAQHRVSRVLFEGEQAVGVAFREPDGDDGEARAPWVVDASGRASVLGRQLGLFRADPDLKQVAVFTRMRGMDLPTGIDAGNILVFQVDHRGWIWMIPFPDRFQSLGVVADSRDLQASGLGPAEFFAQAVQRNPALRRMLAPAERTEDFRVEGDYSYHCTRLVGPGWALLGDAARFVDPIFSSGISLASTSAEFLSDALHQALSRGDSSEAALASYAAEVRTASEIWYRFIKLWYGLGYERFASFAQRRGLRHQFIRIFLGDVFGFEEAFPLLERMEEVMRRHQRGVATTTERAG